MFFVNSQKILSFWEKLLGLLGVTKPRKTDPKKVILDQRVDYDFCRFVHDGDIVSVEKFLTQNPPNQKTINRALGFAAELGHMPLVELFLPLADIGFDNYAALSDAASAGHFDIVKFLTPHCNLKSSVSFVAFGGAVRNGHLDVVRFLSPLVSTKDQRPAFYVAAHKGHLDIVKHILPLMNTDDRARAFFEAAGSGHDDIALLLKEGYVHRRKYDDAAYEAFLDCAMDGHLRTMKLLIPFVDPMKNNSEALGISCFHQKRDVFDFLYPLSDPPMALLALNADSSVPDDKKTFLTERINIERERELLSILTETHHEQKNHGRRRKM